MDQHMPTATNPETVINQSGHESLCLASQYWPAQVGLVAISCAEGGQARISGCSPGPQCDIFLRAGCLTASGGCWRWDYPTASHSALIDNSEKAICCFLGYV